MSTSHHEREEETLIAYFQQMLAEVDDEEFAGAVQASAGEMTQPKAQDPHATLSSSKDLLASANAAIAAEHELHDADFGEIKHLTTNEMLAQEMMMADDIEEVDNSLSAEASFALHQEPTLVEPTLSEPTVAPSVAAPAINKELLAARHAVQVQVAHAHRSAHAERLGYSDESQASASSYSAPELSDTAAQAVIASDSLAGTTHHSSSSIEEAADAAMLSAYGYAAAAAVADDYTSPPPLQTQYQTQTVPTSDTKLDYAQPSESLERLLASVENHVETKPQVVVETKEETGERIIPVKTGPTFVPENVSANQTKVEAVAENTVELRESVVPQAVAINTPVKAPAQSLNVASVPAKDKIQIKTPAQLSQERMSAKIKGIASEWENVDLGEQFQALFFLVQGVRFAVPLIDLGGIFECEKITQLFGKPAWFMGITDVRGAKINIVDTLRWVMPEVGDSPDKYPFLISLGTSQWSIGCDVLEGNRTLSSSQVKWREIPGSRPWLAGIVTSDKCALLHVNALISLFEAGAGIEDLARDLEEKPKEGDKGGDKQAKAKA